jgi:hypothetical protein
MSISFKIDRSVLDYKEEVAVDVSGSTVGECFEYVMQQSDSLKKALLDEKGNLSPGSLIIKVNEEYVIFDALTRSIEDGDRIEIFRSRGC